MTQPAPDAVPELQSYPFHYGPFRSLRHVRDAVGDALRSGHIRMRIPAAKRGGRIAIWKEPMTTKLRAGHGEGSFVGAYFRTDAGLLFGSKHFIRSLPQYAPEVAAPVELVPAPDTSAITWGKLLDLEPDQLGDALHARALDLSVFEALAQPDSGEWLHEDALSQLLAWIADEIAATTERKATLRFLVYAPSWRCIKQLARNRHLDAQLLHDLLEVAHDVAPTEDDWEGLLMQLAIHRHAGQLHDGAPFCEQVYDYGREVFDVLELLYSNHHLPFELRCAYHAVACDVDLRRVGPAPVRPVTPEPVAEPELPPDWTPDDIRAAANILPGAKPFEIAAMIESHQVSAIAKWMRAHKSELPAAPKPNGKPKPASSLRFVDYGQRLLGTARVTPKKVRKQKKVPKFKREIVEADLSGMPRVRVRDNGTAVRADDLAEALTFYHDAYHGKLPMNWQTEFCRCIHIPVKKVRFWIKDAKKRADPHWKLVPAIVRHGF